ncbi:Ig-like domain-containing protein [Anaerocolumna xylanovorans]|uniref:Leucine rich repeat-containing protein n=1 Tax=Anaerocolumna xylanovorans DSM 12503 TaxID=1121345 RepID=A0A1M7Y9C2_9FIRM|nr:Ig-like domain-containing protein [Anaerocolumna xylanovorans]SHO49181.1 Leucine rich repeat-containing protein [Anaerocolumna xylanovorans DSM 12503]
MKKKVLSIVVALCMVLGIAPTFTLPAKAATGDFNIQDGVLVYYGDEFGSPGPENVIIPNGVTEIGKGAFYSHYEITSVSIPNSVKKIDEEAFWGCSSLDSVVVPSSVTSIGKYALGYERDGQFHSPMKEFVIKGTAGSQAQIYANKNDFKFVALPNSKTAAKPHPYATALSDYFKDAKGFTAAYLSDINGDGIKEMVAEKGREDGAKTCRFFYFYKEKLRTYDKTYAQGNMFFSSNNNLIDYSYDMTKEYHILKIKNGKVMESSYFLKDYNNDPENPDYYQNKKKISKSVYDSLVKKYGLSDKNLFIAGTDRINRPDQTAQILAMTTTVKVTGITLNNTSLSLAKGKTYVLKATTAPANATAKTVTWKSSNTKVAAVDKNGKVKAIGKGTATISATATDGSKLKKTCIIIVK